MLGLITGRFEVRVLLVYDFVVGLNRPRRKKLLQYYQHYAILSVFVEIWKEYRCLCFPISNTGFIVASWKPVNQCSLAHTEEDIAMP